jgi:hypothetical protein
MKILITEDQQSSIQEKLQKMVKKLGWEQTAKVVGGSENLKKLSGIKSPIDFLNLFNDLDVVQSEEKPNWTLFRYKKGHNLMVYDRGNKIVFLDYDKIWLVLRVDFGLNFTEPQHLIKEWLVEVYNLRGIITSSFSEEFETGWVRSII